MLQRDTVVGRQTPAGTRAGKQIEGTPIAETASAHPDLPTLYNLGHRNTGERPGLPCVVELSSIAQSAHQYNWKGAAGPRAPTTAPTPQQKQQTGSLNANTEPKVLLAIQEIVLILLHEPVTSYSGVNENCMSQTRRSTDTTAVATLSVWL